MLLGIDVGGTFTDAALVDGGQVVVQAKKPTTHGNLLIGVLAALDAVLNDIGKTNIERVALSTTIVTNAIVENNIDKVALYVIPGPGLDITSSFPTVPFVLSGYVDHRGREVSVPCRDEAGKCFNTSADCSVYAVSGKFSVRNPRLELMVADWIKKQVGPQYLCLGSEVTGALNFVRRTNSAYYNAAVWRKFNMFASAIEAAMTERDIAAPVYILKADGGTLPLGLAKQQPVETIFTGPAASVLGIMAMTNITCPAISLDIGGTTTDIALWRNGVPIFASRGAKIGSYPTAVRAYWLKSVGVGGDSYVRRENGMLKVGPMRIGTAMALGGSEPTMTDAMLVAGLAGFGDVNKARLAMNKLKAGDQTVEDTAQEVLNKAAQLICTAIEDMLAEWAAEPVYRVEDVIEDSRLQPELVVGVGGAAAGLTPLVAAKLNISYKVPAGFMVANAVGAAVARPTTDITLRADTAQGYYTVAELGVKEKLQSRRFDLAQGQEMAERYLRERAAQAAIETAESETVQQEEFNLVRGFHTAGKIITCRMQIKPGVLSRITHFTGKGEML